MARGSTATGGPHLLRRSVCYVYRVQFTKHVLIALATTTGLALSTASAGASSDSGGTSGPQIPAGTTAGYVVLDSATGETLQQHAPHQRFRSASLVKTLIAVDYLNQLGDVDIPDEDRALLEPMLRSSDDGAASELWVRGGEGDIVRRAADLIGLPDTTPPADPGMWGYTAISAADVARTYHYLLHESPPHIGDFVLDNLRQATRCASDGFDQSFGLLDSGIDSGPVKQGWSGFGEAPAPGEECRGPRVALPFTPSVPEQPRTDPPIPEPVDITRPAMHTSGTVDGDGRIIALLTLSPDGTGWDEAARLTTGAARELAGSTRPDLS